MEAITDERSGALGSDGRFKVLLSSVEALLPMPPAVDESQGAQAADDAHTTDRSRRISREEFYADIAPGTRLYRLCLLTTVLSALVAAVGLIRDGAWRYPVRMGGA